MSLSMECYRSAIGIAAAESPPGCSCLVYLDSLVGERPSGCDGWPLTEKDGLVFGYENYDSNLFPPEAPCPVGVNRQDLDIFIQYQDSSKAKEERKRLSRELFLEAQRIRREYLEKIG